MKLGAYASEIVIELPDPPAEDTFRETVMLRKEYGGEDEVYVDNAMEESVPLFDVEKEMDFILFTRKNVENPFYINITDPDLMSTSHFNPKHPTRIAVHGWKPSGTMYNMMKEGNYFCFETSKTSVQPLR